MKINPFIKKIILIVCFLVGMPLIVHAENDIQTIQVKKNIHMLVSPQGGNVVVSTGEDGIFIIDDQLLGRSEIIDKAIKNIRDQNIQFIVNTHYHFDHTGGNNFFGDKKSIIVAHDNVRKRLSTDQFITYFKKKMPALKKTGLPVVTFTNDITFYYNGDSIHIIHVPHAHTDGDAIAYFANKNVLVTGDIVFNGLYPFIDIEHGGSVKGMIAAVDALLKLANNTTVILPGHGPAMNKVELQVYRKALASISGKIEAAIKKGKTLEQVVAAKPSQEFDAKMGAGFLSPDAFVGVLYNDLRR